MTRAEMALPRRLWKADALAAQRAYDAAWKRRKRKEASAYSARQKAGCRKWWAAHAESLKVSRRVKYRETRHVRLSALKAKRASDPVGVRAEARASYKRWTTSERGRAWREAHKAGWASAAKAERVRHPERLRAVGRKASLKRRATKKALFVEDVDPIKVFDDAKGICGYCRKPIDVASKWHIDHIWPLNADGIHGYDNVQPAHARCNLAKHSALPKGQISLFQKKAV